MSAYNESGGGKPAGPLGRLKLAKAERPPLKPTDTTEQSPKARTSMSRAPALVKRAAKIRTSKAKGGQSLKTERPTFGPIAGGK